MINEVRKNNLILDKQLRSCKQVIMYYIDTVNLPLNRSTNAEFFARKLWVMYSCIVVLLANYGGI